MFRVDTKLFRGPRPATSSDLLNLQRNHIDTTICLQYGFYEYFHNDAYETPANVLAHGIKRINIKLGDVIGPTPSKLRAIVSQIQDLKAERSGIYVHCRFGVDRTGMVCGAYRMIVQGWDFADVEREMDRFGFHNNTYRFWKRALMKLEKELQR